MNPAISGAQFRNAAWSYSMHFYTQAAPVNAIGSVKFAGVNTLTLYRGETQQTSAPAGSHPAPESLEPSKHVIWYGQPNLLKALISAGGQDS
jgi:hypothetical protein